MGLALRILAAMALAALGACDRDRPDDDRNAASPDIGSTPPLSARPTPADAATGKEPAIGIATTDGTATALPATGAALLPLSHVLRIASTRAPGEVIEVELDDDDGRSEYEVKILTTAGRSIELKIDAASGTIRETEED